MSFFWTELRKVLKTSGSLFGDFIDIFKNKVLLRINVFKNFS